MTATLRQPTWSLELLDGWSSEEEAGCVSVFRPDGIGALQISAFFRDAPVSPDDLREMAEEHLSAGAIAKPVQLGAFEGFQIAFSADETFWRAWFVRNAHQALYVSYNCSVADRDREVADVKTMLETLHAVDS